MSLHGHAVEGVLHESFSVDSQGSENVEDLGMDVISSVGDDGDDDLYTKPERTRGAELVEAKGGGEGRERNRTFFQPSFPQKLELVRLQRWEMFFMTP